MRIAASNDITLSSLIRSYQDPHGLYAALRSQDQIYYDSVSQAWLVTGYAAITELLSDSRFSSELSFGQPAARAASASFLETAINRQIIFSDGEIHRRVQQVILSLLARMNKELPASIEVVARTLLEDIQGGFDLVDDFTGPFSLLVISQLLGVPTDDMETLGRLARWSDAHGAITSGYLFVDMRDVDRLGDYFRELLAHKRQAPAGDLMGAFLKDHAIFADDDELITNCMMVFGAGRMTTRKLLSQGIPSLMPKWKEWREALQSDPDVSKHLTEELLRMVTPTRYLLRHATEDVDLSGQFPGNHRIRCGDKVMLFLEAGNRDPLRFPQPDRFDLHRQPNRHLAFGFGPHYCPGAKLARLEIQTALATLLANLADLQPDSSREPQWDPNPNLGGYTSFGVCPVMHPRPDGPEA